MKRTVQPTRPAGAKAPAARDPLSLLSRIELAFPGEYTWERPGYDPYDTSRGRTSDVWASKRKRA